jgi:hypothetical protein
MVSLPPTHDITSLISFPASDTFKMTSNYTQAQETEVHGPCDDCYRARAVRRFCHMDGRQFALCETCFSWADHEDDYLMFCDCRIPQGYEGSRCEECRFHIRSAWAWGPEPEPELEEPYIEEQDDDFLAEEPESEEDDNDYYEWVTADGDYSTDA